MQFTVTINFPDETIEKQFNFVSLAELELFLNREFPDATSFVVAWARC